MIPSCDAAKAINSWRGSAVVISTTAALREWRSVSCRRDLDLDLSDCTDKAISVGLGIALARPDRKVMVLDSDTMLRRNLGSLITVGNAAPKNLVHFLVEDGSYNSTEGMPNPGQDRVNYMALAQGGGYPRTYQFDNLEEFVISVQDVLEGDGPTFVSLRVIDGGGMSDYPSRPMADSLRVVKVALAREASA